MSIFLILGCADDQTAERKAQHAQRNVLEIKAILTDLDYRGIYIYEQSGQYKLINYENLSPVDRQSLTVQLEKLIQLGREVLEIDSRRDVKVHDAPEIEMIVQQAENALVLISDSKNESVLKE